MNVEARCRQYIQIIEDRVHSVENQLITIEKVTHEIHGQLNSDRKTILKDEIAASHADIKNTVIVSLSHVVGDKVDGIKDNEERKLNIIVFGVDECAFNLNKKTREKKMTPGSKLKLIKMKLRPAYTARIFVR